MKYLEDDKLTQWTGELTDAVMAGRMINGRIEAFTMKRAGTDKKYAHALGEKYVAEMEQHENQLADYQAFLQRHGKLGQSSKTRKRSISAGGPQEARKHQRVNKRSRSSSLDSSSKESTNSFFPHSALGDFQEIGTRRLMTDLILTLNASFPDYDFGNVRPSHFQKQQCTEAMAVTNNRLSELATRKGECFLREMWNSIDNVICLAESEVYSYVPPAIDEDPMGFLTQTLLDDESAISAPLWSFNYFFVNKHMKRILLFSCVETMRNDTAGVEQDVESLWMPRYKSSEINFDLDPSADVAGGIPVAATM